MEEKANKLDDQLAVLKSKYEVADTIKFSLPRIDPKALQQITISSEALRNSLAHSNNQNDFVKLSESIRNSMSFWQDMESGKMPEGLLTFKVRERKKSDKPDKR